MAANMDNKDKNNMITDVCPICGRDCPLDSPGCGRGRKYAMQKNAADPAYNIEDARCENINAHPADSGRENPEYGPGSGCGIPGRSGHGRHGKEGCLIKGNERDRLEEQAYFKEHGHGFKNSADTGNMENEGRRHQHGHGGMDDTTYGRGRKKRERHGHGDYADKGEHLSRHYIAESKSYADPDADNDLGNMLKKCTDHVYRGEGRRGGQEKILKLLAHNGEMPQLKLQEMLNIKSGSISEILSKMEENGLIERIRFEDDKRRTAVRISESGLHELEKGSRKSASCDPFAALDDLEKDTLKNLLNKLLASWNTAD